jgi:hypothetical protein
MKLVCMIIVAAVLSGKAIASDYLYSSIFYNEELILSLGEMEATFISDKESFSIIACSTEKLECFDTFGIAFSVPKTKLDIGMSWEYKDSTFRVDDYVPQKSSALGTDYFIIRSMVSSNKNIGIFLYSEPKGLMAMRFIDGPHQGTTWLVKSNKGFPK